MSVNPIQEKTLGQLVNWSVVFADPLFYQKKTLLYI